MRLQQQPSQRQPLLLLLHGDCVAGARGAAAAAVAAADADDDNGRLQHCYNVDGKYSLHS